MTPNQKGAIAEAAITKVAVEFGVIVSRPLQDAPYDLIFDLWTSLLRVQCKWAVRRGDVAVIHCVRCRRGPDGFIRRAYAADESTSSLRIARTSTPVTCCLRRCPSTGRQCSFDWRPRGTTSDG